MGECNAGIAGPYTEDCHRGPTKLRWTMYGDPLMAIQRLLARLQLEYRRLLRSKKESVLRGKESVRIIDFTAHRPEGFLWAESEVAGTIQDTPVFFQQEWAFLPSPEYGFHHHSPKQSYLLRL